MTGWPLPTQSRNSIWFLEVFEGEALFRKGPLLRGKQFHAFDSMSLNPRDKPNENIGHCSCMMTLHIPYGHGIHWTPFRTFLSSHFCVLWGGKTQAAPQPPPASHGIFQGPLHRPGSLPSLPVSFCVPWELFASLLLLFPTFPQAFLPPGKVWGTLAIKPSRRPWALGACLLPALSCRSRARCLRHLALRHLAHRVLVSPPFYWLPAPSLQVTFVPAKWESCRL